MTEPVQPPTARTVTVHARHATRMLTYDMSHAPFLTIIEHIFFRTTPYVYAICITRPSNMHPLTPALAWSGSMYERHAHGAYELIGAVSDLDDIVPPYRAQRLASYNASTPMFVDVEDPEAPSLAAQTKAFHATCMDTIFWPTVHASTFTVSNDPVLTHLEEPHPV